MNDWFEIFRTGEHTDSGGNTRNWSASDLDKIAESYDPAKHEAPIVIGHPAANAPAYGWIERLKRSGEILLALPKNVVPEFAGMVRDGIYKKRSISLYPDGSLRHVGFLGAAVPAVKGLSDIAFSGGELCTQYEFSSEGADYGDAERAAYIMKFEEAEERRKRAEEKLKEIGNKLKLTEFRSYLNEKASAGIITPVQCDKLLEIAAGDLSAEFSEEKQSLIPSLKEFVDLIQPQFLSGEMAVKRNEPQETKYKSPAQIIADEIIRGTAVYRNIHQQ